MLTPSCTGGTYPTESKQTQSTKVCPIPKIQSMHEETMRIHVLAHTFHAQPLMCIPAPWILLQWLDTEPAPRPCLILMPPLACYTWHPTDMCKLQQMATPKGILPIHTTDFPLLQCPLLALGSFPSILNAEEKLSLLNPRSMSSCTAFLHSLNKSVIIWLQYDLHITLFPCHFTRWIGNLRTSQVKTLLISAWCSFPEH